MVCETQNLREHQAQILQLRICGRATHRFAREFGHSFQIDQPHGRHSPTHLPVSIADACLLFSQVLSVGRITVGRMHRAFSKISKEPRSEGGPPNATSDGISKRRKEVRAAHSGAALQHTQSLQQIPREAVPISLTPLCHISHPPKPVFLRPNRPKCSRPLECSQPSISAFYPAA